MNTYHIVYNSEVHEIIKEETIECENLSLAVEHSYKEKEALKEQGHKYMYANVRRLNYDWEK